MCPHRLAGAYYGSGFTLCGFLWFKVYVGVGYDPVHSDHATKEEPYFHVPKNPSLVFKHLHVDAFTKACMKG
jgi:hypothetical protein